MEQNELLNEEDRVYEYYSTVTESEVEWLWYPYIPYGKITILQGDPGDGKSTLALNIAATLTRGGTFPDGQEAGQPSNVIYQCPEDSNSDTIKPRLIHAGADCKRIAFICDSNDKLKLDDPRIEKTVADTDCRLLILDPIQSFLMQNGELQNPGKMRNGLRFLSDMAERNHCAVLLIGHMNKSAGGKKIYRGLGSIDIAAAARSILMVSRDNDNPEIRYMFPVKSSLAPEGSAISYIMNREKGFQWIGVCSIDTNELQTRAVRRRTGKKDLAEDLLKVLLSEGDKPVKEILEKVDEIGVCERTAREAEKEMRIIAYRKDNAWYWKMPENETD